MHFGKKLLQLQYTPWSSYYIDYQRLKRVLEVQQQQQQDSDGIIGSQEQEQQQQQQQQTLTTTADAAASSSSVANRGSSAAVAFFRGSLSLLPLSASASPSCRSISDAFLSDLDREVEKVTFFFMEEQGRVAERLARVRREQMHVVVATTTASAATLASSATVVDDHGAGAAASETKNRCLALYEEYQSVSLSVLRLVQFVNLNVTGVRKILKKHDKVTSAKMSPTYFPSLRGGNNSSSNHHHHAILQPLLHCDTALLAFEKTLETALNELRTIEMTTAANNMRASLLPSSSSLSRRGPVKRKLSKLDFEKSKSDPSLNVLQFLETAAVCGSSNSNGDVVVDDSSKSAAVGLKRSFPSSNCITGNNDDDHSPLRYSSMLVHQIHTARMRLQESRNDYVNLLAARMMIEGPDRDDDEPAGAVDDRQLLQLPPSEVRKRPGAASNALNLTSTFLYMTNYYIVAPTSGTYAAALDGNEALASMIIGMTPVAALVSTVLYSWWTCYSYKRPLVFGSCCCMAGNLFYGAGLPANSLTAVMVGRLLSGFGSVRSINRRYIADAYLEEERTAASAIFVTAGSLGMAAGPAVAAALHFTVPDSSENKYWQVENAPGWFMAAAWAVYLLFLVFFFEDPPKRDTTRSGGQQQEQEQEQEQQQEQQQQQQQDSEQQPLITSTSRPTTYLEVGSVNGSAAGGDETQPLLGGGSNGRRGNANVNDVATEQSTWQLTQSSLSSSRTPAAAASSSSSIWKNAPVLITFLVSYFVLKFMLESILSTTPTVTRYYFDWNGSCSGMYMAVLGLLIFPVNVVIAKLSVTYEDRELIVGMLFLMAVSSVGILQYTAHYPLAQYLTASSIGFLCATAVEGPNMSLLSKVIPKSWSTGFWNTGLLATETGTAGRAVADAYLTAVGAAGLRHLLNRAFGTLSVISCICFVITYAFFDHLETPDKEYY